MEPLIASWEKQIDGLAVLPPPPIESMWTPVRGPASQRRAVRPSFRLSDHMPASANGHNSAFSLTDNSRYQVESFALKRGEAVQAHALRRRPSPIRPSKRRANCCSTRACAPRRGRSLRLRPLPICRIGFSSAGPCRAHPQATDGRCHARLGTGELRASGPVGR